MGKISVITTVSCMSSKLNYFVNTEQGNISQNHSNRYLEIAKNDLSVLKSVE